jgi:hypothetical protein
MSKAQHKTVELTYSEQPAAGSKPSKKPKKTNDVGGGPSQDHEDKIEEFSESSTGPLLPESSNDAIDRAIADATATRAKQASAKATTPAPAKEDDISDEALALLQSELEKKKLRAAKLSQLAAIKAEIALEDQKIRESIDKINAPLASKKLEPQTADISDIVKEAVSKVGRDSQSSPPTVTVVPPDQQSPDEKLAAMVMSIVRSCLQEKGEFVPPKSQVPRRQTSNEDEDDLKDDDTSTMTQDTSKSQVLRRTSDRALLAKQEGKRAKESLQTMIVSQKTLKLTTVSAFLVTGSVKEGMPFIASNGEIYMEYLDHVKDKVLPPVRKLVLVCGPPGAEDPPARALTSQGVSVGPLWRNFADANRFFEEQIDILTSPSARHDMPPEKVNQLIRQINAYKPVVLAYFRSQMGLGPSTELGRGSPAGDFQYSDFIALAMANSHHWHRCMLMGDLGKLCEDFNKDFEPYQKLMSSPCGGKLHHSFSWQDVGIYLGLRCTKCKLMGMTEEYCAACQRYPWTTTAAEAKPKQDPQWSAFHKWCKSDAGKKVTEGGKKAHYEKNVLKGTLPPKSQQAAATPAAPAQLYTAEADEIIGARQSLIGLPFAGARSFA